MEQIFEKMLKSALTTLRQLEGRGLVEYKVICGKDQYGGLEIARKPKPRANPLGLPKGTMRNHIVPYLRDMQPGDIVCIPIGKYPAESVRGNACAYANEKWGKSTYTSTVNKETQEVELYRYPLEESTATVGKAKG